MTSETLVTCHLSAWSLFPTPPFSPSMLPPHLTAFLSCSGPYFCSFSARSLLTLVAARATSSAGTGTCTPSALFSAWLFLSLKTPSWCSFLQVVLPIPLSPALHSILRMSLSKFTSLSLPLGRELPEDHLCPHCPALCWSRNRHRQMLSGRVRSLIFKFKIKWRNQPFWNFIIQLFHLLSSHPGFRGENVHILLGS